MSERGQETLTRQALPNDGKTLTWPAQVQEKRTLKQISEKGRETLTRQALQNGGKTFIWSALQNGGKSLDPAPTVN